MNKNKYIVFATIGFELISLLLIAIWGGKKLTDTGYGGTAVQALCILGAFLIWFVSLIIKLKNIKK